MHFRYECYRLGTLFINFSQLVATLEIECHLLPSNRKPNWLIDSLKRGVYMQKIIRFSLCMVVMLLVLAGTQVSAQDTSGGSSAQQFVGNPQYPAPDFATGLDWINVSRPLTMQD